MVPMIVTNKHVIEGSDQVYALCHVADAKNDKTPSGKFIACTISTATGNVLQHPKAEIDLCAVPMANILNQASASDTPIFCVTLGLDLIPETDDWNYFDAIEEVTMIGCPNGLSDEANNLPIVRRGITATSLGKFYNGKPEFMVDMACFPGSSGSPVFLHDRAGYLPQKEQLHDGCTPAQTGRGSVRRSADNECRPSHILAKPSKFEVATMMHLGNAIRSTELLRA